MGFTPQKMAIIAAISLVVSGLVVYASNNIDPIEDVIG